MKTHLKRFSVLASTVALLVAGASPPFISTSSATTWTITQGLGTIKSDGSATLFNNGELRTNVTGSGTLSLLARGDQCGGPNNNGGPSPAILVTVDGQPVNAGTLGSPTSTTLSRVSIYNQSGWVSYPLTSGLSTGTHTVSIKYTNDYSSSTCDRNLHAFQVRLQPFSVSTQLSASAPRLLTDPEVPLAPGALPPAPNEALPYGVDPSISWQSGATRRQILEPAPVDKDDPYDHVNVWGELQLDASNAKAPNNTRVAVADCQLWALDRKKNQWAIILSTKDSSEPNKIDGGLYNSNFSATPAVPPANSDLYVQQADGSISTYVQDLGLSSHFWNTNGYRMAGTDYSHFLGACSNRLITGSTLTSQPPTGDNRAQSGYLMAVGSDWRHAVNGQCLDGTCWGVGHGKFVRVWSKWRRAVVSTLTSADLASVPLPPAQAFRNPDGTCGDGDPCPATAPSPPRLALNTPTNAGPPISGMVRVQATASSPSGVNRVEFYIPGTAVEYVDYTAPYCLGGDSNGICNQVDTTALANTGAANPYYVVTARAFDNNDLIAEAKSRVEIKNP